MKNKLISVEKINNKEIAIKEFKGQRVITLKDIDTVHERADGTARRNFNQNRNRFIEGEDYFKVCMDEIRMHKLMGISNKAREDITLLTEQGYLMLVKSFTDDLAWDVQRKLVKSYFRVKDEALSKQLTINYNKAINKLEGVIINLEERFSELESDIDRKVDELVQQSIENHRPSHRTKLDWNRVIKSYAACKGDEELLKQATLDQFNATKWEDISYDKKSEVLKYIRSLADELKMIVQLELA